MLAVSADAPTVDETYPPDWELETSCSIESASSDSIVLLCADPDAPMVSHSIALSVAGFESVDFERLPSDVRLWLDPAVYFPDVTTIAVTIRDEGGWLLFAFLEEERRDLLEDQSWLDPLRIEKRETPCAPELLGGCVEVRPDELAITGPSGVDVLLDGEEGSIGGGWYVFVSAARSFFHVSCDPSMDTLRFGLVDESLL